MGLVLSLFLSLPLLLAKGLNTTFVTPNADRMCAPQPRPFNIKDQGVQMKHLAGFSREANNETFVSHIACHGAIENTLTSLLAAIHCRPNTKEICPACFLETPKSLMDKFIF